MAIGNRLILANYGFCHSCFNSGERTAEPELHTETETAWKCSDCGGITLEEALFECKVSEATLVLR